MKIDAREVSLTYTTRLGEPVTALSAIDFSVSAGETAGVLGPSGSGKSSLLYLLSGLKRPTAGAVFHDDRDSSSLGEEEMEAFRKAHFGFIFQRHYLISHLTIEENILLPLGRATAAAKKKARALMDRLRLNVSPGRMPGELSVGQRQLAAVARALVNDPAVLFADEPTAALDLDNALNVMDAIDGLLPQAAVVVVTHDFKVLKHAGSITKLRDGKKV